MEEIAEPFVRRAIVSFGRGQRTEVQNPTWSDLKVLLNRCREQACRLDLYNESETQGLTLFADRSGFHITISVDETYYYFVSNGDATDDTVDLFGHSFNREQVLNDFEIVTSIIKNFWAIGERSSQVQWLEEMIEV